jgi:MraZ protein
MWVGMAVGALLAAAGVTLVLGLRDRGSRAAGPAHADSRESVRLCPPAPVEPTVALHPPEVAPPLAEPQASLLQPVPASPEVQVAGTEAGIEPARRLTVARWPLETPAEPPPAPDSATWSRPVEPPPPTGADIVRPIPALAAAPRARPLARTRPRPLTGTHACRLEDDGSLVLPAGVRRQLNEPGCRQLFAMPGPDPCVGLYTGTDLERWAEQLDQAAAPAARVCAARRQCLAETEACAVDRAGRLHFPERLAAYAGLHQEAVLIGVGDHLELWDTQRWQEYLGRPNGKERGR